MTKAELRRIYLSRQRALSAPQRAEKSERIAERLLAEFDLDGVRYLHCFLPIEKFNEIETGFIFERLWRDYPGVTTLVPRVDRQTNEIENLRYDRGTKLVESAWQILEPDHHEIVPNEALDLVLVPLLCVDRRGHRVGYGKGFYDRLLGSCRPDCRRIGLGYFPPAEEISDAQDFDVSLECCVTPEKTFDFGQDKS